MLGHACHTEAVPAHRCFKGPAGGHGVGSLDVKSVRDPGQHQHSAASLGSASQHSKPSRASIDAYSLLPQPQSPHTTLRQNVTIPAQRQIQVCSSHVCGLQVGTQEVQEAASEWSTQELGLECWLMQQQAGSRQGVDREQLAAGSRRIGFANEGQFLATSAASLQDVNKRVQGAAAAKKQEPVQVSPERFRPNLVFGGATQPYVEDT
ncbi:g3769 [Coccomyxa viridis]|uniref:G3769 protein n=1 Tax=Coccomyxa viridis TaxID=1274662 RepID=A0ABP1FNL1_9CHLO